MSCAAGLLVGIFFLQIGWKENLLSQGEVQEVVQLHRRSLTPGKLVDIDGSDVTKISAWFNSRLDFTAAVPKPVEDFTLIGGRLDWCDHQKVAATVYGKGGHIINLISYPAEQSGTRKMEVVASDGVSMCGWIDGSLQYVAVSDLPAAEIRRFSELISRTVAFD